MIDRTAPNHKMAVTTTAMADALNVLSGRIPGRKARNRRRHRKMEQHRQQMAPRSGSPVRQGERRLSARIKGCSSTCTRTRARRTRPRSTRSSHRRRRCARTFIATPRPTARDGQRAARLLDVPARVGGD